MRYVIFTYVHEDDAATWEAQSPEEQATDVERHRSWFGQWHEQVKGGEELDAPRLVKTLRPGRQGEGITVTDGPFIEAKEFLGGFIVVEADSMEDAVEMARGWPSLASQPNAVVQVQPVYVRD